MPSWIYGMFSSSTNLGLSIYFYKFFPTFFSLLLWGNVKESLRNCISVIKKTPLLFMSRLEKVTVCHQKDFLDTLFRYVKRKHIREYILCWGFKKLTHKLRYALENGGDAFKETNMCSVCILNDRQKKEGPLMRYVYK